MKIFVDENIPLMTVQALRADGHDVLDIGWTQLYSRHKALPHVHQPREVRGRLPGPRLRKVRP